MSSPTARLAAAHQGEQTGQHPLEHDAGSELVVGGADDEPPEHGFGLVGGDGAEAGECQQGVEIVEPAIGDAPPASALDELRPVAQAVPFALELGRHAEPGRTE